MPSIAEQHVFGASALRLRRFHWLTVLVVTSGLVVSACGDDDDFPAEDPAATTEQTDEASASPTPYDLDLQTRVESLATALDAESSEIEDEATVRFVLRSGTSSSPQSSDCLAAGATLPDDVKVTMVYPDGELEC